MARPAAVPLESEAVDDFVGEHPEFVVEQPPWLFNESDLRSNVTHWPRGYVRRVR